MTPQRRLIKFNCQHGGILLEVKENITGLAVAKTDCKEMTRVEQSCNRVASEQGYYNSWFRLWISVQKDTSDTSANSISSE